MGGRQRARSGARDEARLRRSRRKLLERAAEDPRPPSLSDAGAGRSRVPGREAAVGLQQGPLREFRGDHGASFRWVRADDPGLRGAVEKLSDAGGEATTEEHPKFELGPSRPRLPAAKPPLDRHYSNRER